MVTAKQKAPDSYSEMAKDEHFIRFMKKNCDEIETSFWSRPKPKKGVRSR